jgi:hypothetical protein
MRKGRSMEKYVKGLVDKVIEYIENSGYSPIDVDIHISGQSEKFKRSALIADEKIPVGIKTANSIFYKILNELGDVFYTDKETFEGMCDLQEETERRGEKARQILREYSKGSGVCPELELRKGTGDNACHLKVSRGEIPTQEQRVSEFLSE